MCFKQYRFYSRIHLVQGRFSESLSLLNEIGCPPGSVDGIVMDLGASSMQMDSENRGFGLSRDSPLDMRMTYDPELPRLVDRISRYFLKF